MNENFIIIGHEIGNPDRFIYWEGFRWSAYKNDSKIYRNRTKAEQHLDLVFTKVKTGAKIQEVTITIELV